MIPVVSADHMRELDRRTIEKSEISSLTLMLSASAACFRAIQSHFKGQLAGQEALILCGKGNNGGDGAGLARLLAEGGVKSTLVLFGKYAETSGDAETNFGYVRRRSGSEFYEFIECDTPSTWDEFTTPYREYDLIVDALFGTGLTRPLEGVYPKVIDYVSSLRRRGEDAETEKRPWILSVDLPSGLNSNLAELIGPTVKADATVTFTAPKPANVLPPASDFNGTLTIEQIGTPQWLIEEVAPVSLFLTEAEDARRWLRETRYVPGSYKNAHGNVLIVAGSRGYSGAAALCGNSAMRSGAGLVTVATPVSAQPLVASGSIPEVMTTALAETDRGAVSDEAIEHFLKLATKKGTVVAIGPGLTSDDERTRRFVLEIVKRRSTPCVIDADGLNCLAPWPADLRGSSEHPLVLTPHPGEMARLTGKSEIGDRVAAAREFATGHEVILLLKGSRSIVAAPDGRVFINPTGNPGLGRAGSGDTLTGLIAGFLTQAFATLKDKADPLAAVIAALYIGALAGDFAARKLGMRTMLASDIREHFSEAIRFLDPEGEQP
ncbi:MAG TPA: NAD(P)H-hydrate dehydratase [Pyrinomonadaceae bacterium]|nr:NAD(P)H-hydrate dehydratase [Pyrinomonadaceae bacterium]